MSAWDYLAWISWTGFSAPRHPPLQNAQGWVSMQTGLGILNWVFWFCLPGYWYGCCCSCRTCRARRIYITWLDLVKKMLCRAGCMLLTWGWTWICWIEPFAPTHENTQGWISTISYWLSQCWISLLLSAWLSDPDILIRTFCSYSFSWECTGTCWIIS